MEPSPLACFAFDKKMPRHFSLRFDLSPKLFIFSAASFLFFVLFSFLGLKNNNTILLVIFRFDCGGKSFEVRLRLFLLLLTRSDSDASFCFFELEIN